MSEAELKEAFKSGPPKWVHFNPRTGEVQLDGWFKKKDLLFILESLFSEADAG